MVNGIRAFLPGSLVDIRPVKDTTPFENKALEFKVIKLDRKRNNVVVSRRAVLEASLGEEREKLLSTLQEGAIVKGIVKNITDYGAFVDLGGIDGLLHITDLAWRRVKHPSEVLAVGDEVTAKILKFDQEKNRVSLGMKQLGEDPWVGLSRRYPTGTRLFGKVTNITDYGAFVEIESGIEGLVHVSEMDWTNKNIHPTKVVQLGDEVEVMILEIDEDRRRISLGMKQCMSNPVGRLRDEPQEGRPRDRADQVDHRFRRVRRPARRHRRAGAPVRPVVVAARREPPCATTRRAQDVEAVVLAIDVERERISLGIKQLDGDPFTNYVAIARQGQHGQGHGEVARRQGRGHHARRRRRGVPARLGSRARPRRGHPDAPEGGRSGHRDDHQHRPQEPQHQSLDQGEGPRRGDGGDPEHQGRHVGHEFRDHQSRRAAAGQDGQQDRPSKQVRVMTKSELIDRLAAQFPQLVAKDAELAVKMILDAMAESLAKGERIEIRGFGSFGLNYRPPRTGRNPKSGDKVQVPEKHVPHFKAGKELRERVDFKNARMNPRGQRTSTAGGNRRSAAATARFLGRGVMQVLRWIVGITLFLALLFLSLQNSELVTLKFYHWWSWQAPLIFVVLIAFALGAAAGLLAGAVRSARLSRQLTGCGASTAPRDGAPPPDWARTGTVPGTDARIRAGRPVDGRGRRMDFELWWLLPIPACSSRWAGSRRASTSSICCANRARCRCRISAASISC